jgi:hypothetical protein
LGGWSAFYAEWASVLWLATTGVAVLALVGVGLVWARHRRLLRTYQHFMTGASARNLEGALAEYVAQTQEALAQTRESRTLARQLERDARQHIQHAGIVRYNPFQDTGGDQSFALALADALGNGVVLSSLHARNVTRVYAKPLVAWDSHHTLTDEERLAIQRAQGQS